MFGREIVVRELTVSAIRTIFSETTVDSIGDTLFAELRLADLQTFTSLTKDDVENMSPSQIRQVIDLCKEKNPDFFGMLARFHSRLARP